MKLNEVLQRGKLKKDSNKRYCIKQETFNDGVYVYESLLMKAEAKHNLDLYKRDFYAWILQQLELLREGDIEELDIPNLIEEIEDMGKSQKQALESNLRVVLMHLLKWKVQPNKRTSSWKITIREHRRRVSRQLKDSPSLKGHLVETFAETYQEAREDAAYETEMPLDLFPSDCLFSIEQVLDLEFLP